MRWNEWSGEPWFVNSSHSASPERIQVIEPAATSKQKKRKAKAKKVPFGFTRELPKKKKKKKGKR
jgi:hypothetical protein